MPIRTKRIYDEADESDGHRLLVMRLWPRGVRKERVDAWDKGLAPTRELLTEFQSPKAPSVNVPTKVNPNRTFIPLPNGERRSIQHAQPVRLKSYRVTGLTQAEAQSWLDVFNANEGIRLVIVSDDEDETYPSLMNTELPKNRELDNFTVDLEFVEIKL